MIRLDLEPVGEEPFRSHAQLHSLPDLSLASVASSAFVGTRSPELIDERREVSLVVPFVGPLVACQGAREAMMDQGSAIVMRDFEPGRISFPDPAKYVGLRVPECMLQSLVADLDATVMRVIPAESTPLRLLLGYVNMLTEVACAPSIPTRLMIANHLRDLAAAAIGVVGEEEERTKEDIGNLRAMRSRAVRADIARNAADRTLTLAKVAKRQNISESYVRKLLAREGTSFTDYLLGQRLDRAYHTLRDPRFAHANISAVAYSTGFNDIFYFNRSFRRRYGATPSEIRAYSRDS